MPATDSRGADRLSDLPGLTRTLDGFEPLAEALRAGRSRTIDGAWGPSAALPAGTLAIETPSTLLIVLAHFRDLPGWEDEIGGFAKIKSVVFPAEETTPGARLKVLQKLLGGEPPRVVLTPMSALIQ